jgi:Mg/Co/Ni transporter MgtE
MQKIITKWLKHLLINNVGGLLSGSAIKLFSKIIEQIFVVFKFLLGNLFGKSSSED